MVPVVSSSSGMRVFMVSGVVECMYLPIIRLILVMPRTCATYLVYWQHRFTRLATARSVKSHLYNSFVYLDSGGAVKIVQLL